MRWMIVCYVVAAIWLFGWLTGIFGFLPALGCSVVFSMPAVIASLLFATGRQIAAREYGYLVAVSMFTVAGCIFLVSDWFAAGLDRRLIFDREYSTFRNRVSNMPEFKDVEISYTPGKGGLVLDGSVAAKESHDRLIEMAGTIQNNDNGVRDSVDYPGTPISDVAPLKSSD